MNPIKLLIIDEHPAVRQALVVRLRSAGHLSIVAVDDNLREGLHHAQELLPHIVLLGLSTRKEPPYSLIDVVRKLAAANQGVIVLTSFVDVVEREVLLQAGARRYLLKNINSNRLIAELEAVANEIKPEEST
ncbi:MAG: response regulator transcription factor [Anaerolineales bacterium]|nr:response regulator transcription factor [Anaerolineales bacterium]MCB8950776.1 response regulator transcription factor [Ardenticatenales bacterium]